MRWLVKLALSLMLIWSVAVAALLLFRHELIYPFRDWPRAEQVAGVPRAEVVRLVAPDGVALILWVVRARAHMPTVLHFTGNAGSLPSSGPRLAELALAGFGVVAMNYRGAGGAPGSPGQTVLIADALAVYDALPNLGVASPPVLYGTSLGAALAVQVAARRSARALILEAPFAELCQTAQYHYPWVPG